MAAELQYGLAGETIVDIEKLPGMVRRQRTEAPSAGRALEGLSKPKFGTKMNLTSRMIFLG
jgi:hypothetical protein